MKYLFLLGRNTDLSIAEIFSYFERDGFEIRLECLKSNGALIDSKEKLDIKKAINRLGGTLAVGEVLFSGDLSQLSKEISQKQIYFGTSNKTSYSLFNFADQKAWGIIALQIKSNFKQEKLKTKYILPQGFITMQEGRMIFGSPSKIKKVDGRYFLFEKEGLYFFGNLSEVFDSKASEKRDMEKPSRRESLAISPRLAKILINLSSVKENNLLLDAFCGIGVILQEALLNNINILGVDLDKEAITDCKKNLDWLRKNYNINSKSQLVKGDSGNIVLKQKISGIATEPSLGKLLKKYPKKDSALKMTKEFENLMIYVLGNLKKYLSPDSKIAFTSPYILANKERISCDINHVCSKTGLKIYKLKNSEITFPIPEFREDQAMGREIYVLTN